MSVSLFSFVPFSTTIVSKFNSTDGGFLGAPSSHCVTGTERQVELLVLYTFVVINGMIQAEQSISVW